MALTLTSDRLAAGSHHYVVVASSRHPAAIGTAILDDLWTLLSQEHIND